MIFLQKKFEILDMLFYGSFHYNFQILAFDSGFFSTFSNFLLKNCWKRGAFFYLFILKKFDVFERGGRGVFVTNDRRKRGGVFYLFLTNSMFLNGVGVGCFVTNDRRKRGGVFYLILTNSMFLNRRQRGVFFIYFSQISMFKRSEKSDSGE